MKQLNAPYLVFNPSKTDEVEARATTKCINFLERLENVGYRSSVDENPKKIVHLLIRCVKPSSIKLELQRQVRYDRKLKNDVKYFMHAWTDRRG